MLVWEFIESEQYDYIEIFVYCMWLSVLYVLKKVFFSITNFDDFQKKKLDDFTDKLQARGK